MKFTDILERRRAFIALGCILACTFAAAVFVTAWVCDDAYISFRTIDNFVNGYGLRWNTSQRVQVYTHPLWLFLLSPVYFITGEIYFSNIAVSIVFSCLAFGLLVFRISKSFLSTLFLGAAVAGSRAFIEFSTSGLEAPLTHVLIACFFIVYSGSGAGEIRRFKLLCFITALAALNRLDILLLFLPALIFRALDAYASAGSLKTTLKCMLLGFSPLVAWELFSLVYYGVPFPNTAYAKIFTGIGRGELVIQGFHYVYECFRHNLATVPVIMWAILIAAVHRDTRTVPAAAGILLYLAYVIYIGGDFMSGRFLTPPFFLAICVLSGHIVPRRAAEACVAGLIVLMMLVSVYEQKLLPPIENRHGIVNERLLYFRHTGLVYALSGKKMPSHRWAIEGAQKRRSLPAGEKRVLFTYSVGFFGFEAGPGYHLIEPYAITDPFLARLKATVRYLDRDTWRIGHFIRNIPPGYMESVRTGKCLIEDADKARLYDLIAIVTQGDIFSVKRLGAIWKLNTGSN